MSQSDCPTRRKLLKSDEQPTAGQASPSLRISWLCLCRAGRVPESIAEESRERMSAARDMFRQTLNVLDDLRSRGAFDASSEGWAKGIAGEMAKCDTALGK